MQSIIIIAGWHRFLAIGVVSLHSVNCAAKDNNNTALLETSNNLSGPLHNTHSASQNTVGGMI